MIKNAIVIMAVFLTGCVKLDIRSELSKIDLYVLDTMSSLENKVEEKTCKNYKNIAILGILSPDIYETKQILMYSNDGKMKALTDKQWADIPKNLFKNLLVNQANKHCIFLSSPPLGSSVPKKLLKLDLFSFILEDSPKPQARISLGYEIFSGGKKSSGVLNRIQEINEAENDPIKALQKASKDIVFELIDLIK